MYTISLINLKGGVGKTTTAHNLAVGLARINKKVLLVDLDPQANITSMLIEPDENKTISQLLVDPNLHEEIIKHTKIANLDIIPASLELSNIEQKIRFSNGVQYKNLHKIKRLIQDNYDYMIIDNSPYMNMLTVNSIYCSNEVIIPIKPDVYAKKGFDITIKNVLSLEEELEIDVKTSALFTIVGRNNAEKSIINSITESNPNMNIYKTSIRYQSSPVTNASNNLTAVIDKQSSVANDYKEFINEVLGGN